jgi:hypothetical protein
VFKLTNITACPKFTAEGKVYATTHIAKADTKLSPGPDVTPEGHGSHSTDQPKGTDVGHTRLSVGFSKVIPETDIGKAEYPNTQQGLPEFGYTLARI